MNSQSPNRGTRKLVWAVDPTPSEFEIQKGMVGVLERLQQDFGMEVTPVSVVSRETFSRDVELRQTASPEVALGQVESELSHWLAGLSLPNLKPLELIHVEKDAMRVEALVGFARKTKHHAIAVASHGRSGFDRLILGSFAEDCLMKSSLPVLVASPHLYHPGRVEKILFPTDFSTDSWEAFEMAVGVAKDLGARLVLFHELSEVPFETPSHPVPWDLKPQAIREAERESEGWVSFARERGVDVIARMEKRGRNPGQAILSFAHRTGSSLIIMASEGGPLRSAILGSAVGEVIRHSHCPVLVWRPRAAWAAVEIAEDKSKGAGGRRG